MTDASDGKKNDSYYNEVVYEALMETIVENQNKLNTHKYRNNVVYEINSNDKHIYELYEYMFLEMYVKELKTILKKYGHSSSVHAAVDNKVNKYETKIRAKEKEYEKKYGESPKKALSKIPKYSYNDLAMVYHDYCKDNLKSAPTTNELGNHTKISQATWYRTFKQKDFWEELQRREDKYIEEEKAEMEKHKKLHDCFIEVKISIQDRIESKSIKKIENKKDNSVPMEEYADQGIPSIDNKIDIDTAIAKMPRNKLIEKIIVLDKKVKIKDLEKNTDDELRELYRLLGSE